MEELPGTCSVTPRGGRGARRAGLGWREDVAARLTSACSSSLLINGTDEERPKVEL